MPGDIPVAHLGVGDQYCFADGSVLTVRTDPTPDDLGDLTFLVFCSRHQREHVEVYRPDGRVRAVTS